jgi:hypothetical protein
MAMNVRHSASAPEPVRFAASELAAYLGRMTGQPVALVEGLPAGGSELELRAGPGLPLGGTAGGAASAPAGMAAELAARVRPLPPPYAARPGADAFLWRTGAGEAAIVGTNPRSVLFGLYDLLEALGCRFFGASGDDEVVPGLTDDPFARAGERFEQASFPFRERHFLEASRRPDGRIDVEAARREIDFAAKRRMNGFSFHIEDFAPDPADWRVVLEELVPEVARRGLMPGLGEHGGYPLWLPPERYAAEHPDWYAEVNGQRVGSFRGQGRYQFCTEHPQALATFLDNMVDFLRANPAIQIMHIAPEDVGRWCECARCAPIPVADRYLRVDNAIAERVLAVRPDVWVTHLVYANHAELPVDERPSPRLNVSFVPFGRDYGHPFVDPRANMRFSAHPWSLELIQAWARLCAETGAGFVEHSKAFRNRWTTFRLLPLPHLAADLRWWQSIGAGGFNAPQEGEGSWVKHLNSYVLARLMWDLDGSTEALLDDYFERYWAGLGPSVREIYQAIAEALPNLSYSRNQPALLPNRSPGIRPPPEEQWAPDAAYLEGAIERLGRVGPRLAALRASGAPEPAVGRRLARLADAVEGALAGLAVSLEIRRFLLARGTPQAGAGAARLRAAHDRFAALQTPERLAAGTLWTGAWRRDETLAEWEREVGSSG